jgi:hypothetical protein
MKTYKTGTMEQLNTKDRKANISCLHVMYNRTAFDRVLPNDTIYIGSLRDPFDQFMSAMFYFDMFKGLKIQGPNAITDFLRL